MWILAGDVGGTNTRLQLVEKNEQGIEYHARISYPSQEYENLSDVVKLFFQQTVKDIKIQKACFAVAGPVREMTAKVTNLPWQLDVEQLQRDLGFPLVVLINDFQAIGYGISMLEDNELLTVQYGVPELHGRRALIGAGTGLGETLLTWQTDHYQPWPTEGGHVDFAPTNELEIELLSYLKTKHDHVSYELLLSGLGITRIYSFLRDVKNIPESSSLAALIKEDDPATVISNAALNKNDELSSQALNCFMNIYAAQAGNVALNHLATGGVYIAGGIAPKIIDKFKDAGFLQTFNNKGKMSALMNDIPVKVILNDNVGLLGAVQYALMADQ